MRSGPVGAAKGRAPDRQEARGDELSRMAGSASPSEFTSGLGGRAALALGLLLPSILLLEPGEARSTVFITGCGIFAISAGAVLLRFPRALPMWLLDGLLIVADALLAALGIFEDSLQPALPGTFVLIGTILFAVRAWWIACVHVGLLGTSYALVLGFADTGPGPVLRWVTVMAAITCAGLFLRWLVDQVLALARDESAFRSAAEAATDELQRVSEMRSAFLARMSHELRTPLNVVLGFSDLLAEQVVGPLNDKQLEYTRDISSSARHQVELVDEVLDLAKVESGRSFLRTDEVDLRSILGEAVRMVRDSAERKGLQLVLSVEPGLGLVLADRLKIRQVVVNLLANAVKFTPAAGHIRINARPTGDRVEVTVTDSGVGMSSSELAGAFDEFTTAARMEEGTGLGLPLARRLIELHGGSLTATSTPNGGSVFRFDLPLRSPAAMAAEAEMLGEAIGTDPLTHADHSAFTQPGSVANRALIAVIAGRFLIAGAVLFTVLSIVTTGPPSTRLTLFGAAVMHGLLSVLVRRRIRTAPSWQIETLAWVGIATVTAMAYFADSYISITALAYGCVTTTGFALWPRRRAIMHLIGIAGAYAGVLVITSVPEAATQWLAVLILLAFQGEIVSWIAERLRRLVVEEQSAHRTAARVRAELEATSRHKSVFLANMSHELRTPLNAIIGFADLLDSQLGGPLNQTQREFVQDIQLSARHLLSLINLVLDVAKLDAGRMTLDLDVVSVRGLVERAVSTAQQTDPETTPPIAFTINPGADFVVGDHHLLEKALAQLISNALRFTPDAGRISVVASPADQDILEIAVNDSGVGIAASQHAAIFEPFHHGKPLHVENTPHGTGLGLALVRGLAELHGGHVWLTSTPLKGSTFTLVLPRRVSSPEALESAIRVRAV